MAKKKILIIKMSALGDGFIAMPHIEAILSHHKGDEIWIMSSPPLSRCFANHPVLRLIVLDRAKIFEKQARWARILWVRKQKFDVVYDLQGNRTSGLLVRFSKATKRVGTQPKKIYNYHPILPYTNESRQSVFDRLNETLTSAGLHSAGTSCELYPSLFDQDSVSDWKKRYDLINNRYVVIHAGSSAGWTSKRWPPEYFRRLAKMIEKKGIKCIWTGGAEDQSINQKLAKTVGIDATGVFDVLALYLLGKGASFAIANDSAPMHIFAAGGTPVFGFFGPTSWFKNHATGQKGRILKTDMECSPCFKGKCPPEKKHACLVKIDPKDVFKKIQQDIGI